MKYAFVFCLCVSVALALPKQQFIEDPAEECSDTCAAPKCRCSSGTSPLELDNTPQLISLTFDEAVVENLYTEYWVPILDRTNPDDAQIGATFYVPHEYTDYSIVNELYNFGFEIGVHSITKDPLQKYWREADQDTLVNEFQGQREIVSLFANIPTDDIVGARTPQLQINGNVSIEAYVKSGITYDSSQPTLRAKPLFPYTLDYKSTQQCLAAAVCPTESFPGFWVLPIVNLEGIGKECNALGDCNENGTSAEITTWLNTELENIKTSKAPLTIRISTSWFSDIPGAFDGLTTFLDSLSSQKDVFLVTQKQILDWIQSPVALSDFKTDVPSRDAVCSKVTCRLEKSEDEIRYMNACVPCPDVYPWLGNPEGKA